ncbi:MAG: hypothetical protein GF383_07310 [Candidatus Lokiarchaeota archaeon]|nr:hypothetical protein [Candidatus Lokiarchaeota archaeon]MBD3339976.1 hypothetical protein [Candidatus Lokiarchaeota archaeon]
MPESEQNKEEQTNNSEKEKEKDHYIYAKVPEETRKIIDELKDQGKTISYIISSAIDIYFIYNSMPQGLKDYVEKHSKEFGGRRNVVKEAIRLLQSQEERDKAEDIDLWIRARREMNMMLVGKKMFIELISYDKERNYKITKKLQNLALDIILWYLRKPIKDLSFEEFLFAVKRIWIVLNYFTLIDVKKESNKIYYVTFKHSQNKIFSDFWKDYFIDLFKLKRFAFECIVEGESYEESFSLTIKKILDK